MKRFGKIILHFLRSFIDFFYPPFRKLTSIQFFRYGFVGGINLVLDWVLYFIIYQFVLQQQMLELGFITISSHIATFGIKFPIIMFSGFLMQKYITFSHSNLASRKQLFRYILVVAVNLTMAYFVLKFLVEYLYIYPTPSNMIVTVISIAISYFLQKHFTFRMSGEISETRTDV
ncbi:MAG: phenylalanine 4-monooxygenase [Marinilabiliales bacterium]|mgnify:CR=1 FL=1|nr:MAG: phenylalanine 4-monooxygenase [Marinilabiliales bacterium]